MTDPHSHDNSSRNLEDILLRLGDTMNTVTLKLDDWIFKINQYFEYHGTPERDRLSIASFYMEGRALAWFQWMTSNAQFTSWPEFLQALQTRFAPSQYEDPTGALFKLTQKGSVGQYLSEFEDLANRIIGLPPPFILSCFIFGLSPEIRREVQALHPLTLVQAAGLARLQEEKLADVRPPPRPRPPPPPPALIRTNPSHTTDNLAPLPYHLCCPHHHANHPL